MAAASSGLPIPGLGGGAQGRYERVPTPGDRSPRWSTAALFDVDDAPMMKKRQNVMNVCMVQGFLSLALVTNYRRSPVLLVMQPFFLSAAVLGYQGAKHCKALYVAAHFMGSAGLALIFLFFILAETLLKHAQNQQHANADLFFIIINAPMDLFLFTTSAASVILYLSLKKLQKQLQEQRDRIRENFDSVMRGENVPGGLGGVPAGMAGVELSDVGAAAEARRRNGLKQDLRCPITLEVMVDPVIASDGHSYEREAIERWFTTHRTSPLTGRAMPNHTLIPNHRLRTLIQDMVGGGAPPGGIAAGAATAIGATASPADRAPDVRIPMPMP
jgi:hypothetical protein